MATSVVFPRVQFFANNGRPLIGGRIHTYVAGSSTRARTYKDAAMAQPNTNPIVLDARGEAAIYLAEGVEYKFVLEDSQGALIMTQQPVYGAIWPNAKDWPSDATLSYQYMTEAKAAAGSIGPLKFYDTYAQAMGDVAGWPAVGLIEISRDETKDGARTRYRPAGATLVFVVNLDQLRLDLNAEGKGSQLIFGVAQVFNAQSYGAKTTAASAENTAAFLRAIAAAGRLPIYVPSGTFNLTNPYDFPLTAQFYGDGVLKFDLADHRRRGGSSGSVSVPERYTIFYQFAQKTDVSILFDGIAQEITWANDFTAIAPGSLVTQAVTVRVAGGQLPLGPSPVSCVVSNAFMAGGRDIQPISSGSSAWEGSGNTSLGGRALMSITNGVNNTAIGDKALRSVTTGQNNIGIGYQALYRITNASKNTALGSIAGEWLESGHSNTLMGAGAGARLRSGTENVAIGVDALADSNVSSFNVAIGLRALGNTSAEPMETVAIGAFAGAFAGGGKNTFVGYRAGCGPNSGTDGFENVFVGFFAGRNHVGADMNVGIGVSSLLSLTGGVHNTALGHSSASAYTGSDIVAIGYRAAATNIAGLRMTSVGSQSLEFATGHDGTAVGFAALAKCTTGEANTAIGAYAGLENTTGTGNTDVGRSAGTQRTTGGGNTNVGRQSGQYTTTGSSNTNIGVNAGRLSQDGSNATDWSGTACIGFESRVSGNNQIQLGFSSATTYAYGAVQDRSDARDKTDIRDTVLGLDFINALRAVDFKWDMRDDYVVTKEDGSVEVLPKDGSKTRNRFHHGLIAQELRTVMESHGVDFGGLQDHAVNGGCDILSIGYTELIGPLIKAVQELSEKVDVLEKKISTP